MERQPPALLLQSLPDRASQGIQIACRKGSDTGNPGQSAGFGSDHRQACGHRLQKTTRLMFHPRRQHHRPAPTNQSEPLRSVRTPDQNPGSSSTGPVSRTGRSSSRATARSSHAPFRPRVLAGKTNHSPRTTGTARGICHGIRIARVPPRRLIAEWDVIQCRAAASAAVSASTIPAAARKSARVGLRGKAAAA